jgi:hypothetical protein
MRNPIPVLPLLLAGVAVAVCLLPRRGHTVPRYAALTGLPCGRCHFDPDGGGARNAFGFRYARNRHLLDVADTTPEPSGDTLLNRAGGTTPIFLGADQRFSLFMRQYSRESRPERVSFLEMESLIHLAFQPHPALTLVYALQDMGDGAAHTVRSREAFGLLAGMPWNGYLKAGRFLVPFGLRMEDPGVATRGGLGGGIVGGNFLPFDPRLPDMGVEVGVGSRGFFGRASFTNGHSNLFSNGYAEAKVVKLGYGSSRFQSGLSLHDDFAKVGGTPFVRYTYWSGYALARAGPESGSAGAGHEHLRSLFARR